MAIAHPPVVDREREMLSTHNNAAAVVQDKRNVSPVLIGLLIVMAVFPFVVEFLPSAVREYIGLLFR